MTNDTMKNQICHFTFDRIRKFLMRQLFLITIFTFQLLLINCKDNPKPKFYIDQETKDFTVFQKGTYWIFENQFNDLDSQFVIRFSTGMGGRNLHFDPEYFQLNIKSSFLNDEMVYQARIDVNDKKIFYVSQMWINSFIHEFNSYVSADLIGQSMLNCKLIDTSSVFKNGFHIFKTAKKFKTTAGFCNSYQEVIWAKHVGRNEYLDSEGRRWKLKRFKVIQ